MSDKRQTNHHAPGVAGASARREYERRKQHRERTVREKHPRLGGLLLALNRTPQHVSRWERGAEGEELVAIALAARCNDTVVVLHDRRVPGRRTNIDHVAIAPSGVWVIDTKRYKGTVKVRGELFGKPALLIAGRDQTKLVDGLAVQVEAVRGVLAGTVAAATVHGCFCFVDANLPVIGTPTIKGFQCLTRRRLARRLNASGTLTPHQVGLIADRLTAALPAA